MGKLRLALGKTHAQKHNLELPFLCLCFHTDVVNKVGTEGTQPAGKSPSMEDQICSVSSFHPAGSICWLLLERKIGSTIFSEVKYLSGRTKSASEGEDATDG